MTKQNKKTFVLSDESVNTYGFRILTSGVDLAEFRKNPVMLYNHNGWDVPIGKWDDIRVEGGKILADAVFDLKDDRAAEIARKVNDGFIRACSGGFWTTETSTDPLLYVPGQTAPTVVRCTMREASICSIPANHNALALYDANGERIKDEDIKGVLQLSAISNNPINKTTKQTTNMNEEVKNLLQLSDGAGIPEVVAGITALKQANAQLTTELTALRRERDEANARELETKKATFTQLFDKAVKNGAFAESQRESMVCLFDKDPDQTIKVLSALPQRRSVASLIDDANRKDKTTSTDLCDKSWRELDRSGKLAELRDNHPDVYREKYKGEFGVYPSI